MWWVFQSRCMFYLCFLGFVFSWFSLHTRPGSVQSAQNCYWLLGLEVRTVVCSFFRSAPSAVFLQLHLVPSLVHFVVRSSSFVQSVSSRLFCFSDPAVGFPCSVVSVCFSASPWHIISPFMVQVQLQCRFHWKWTLNTAIFLRNYVVARQQEQEQEH